MRCLMHAAALGFHANAVPDGNQFFPRRRCRTLPTNAFQVEFGFRNGANELDRFQQ